MSRWAPGDPGLEVVAPEARRELREWARLQVNCSAGPNEPPAHKILALLDVLDALEAQVSGVADALDMDYTESVTRENVEEYVARWRRRVEERENKVVEQARMIDQMAAVNTRVADALGLSEAVTTDAVVKEIYTRRERLQQVEDLAELRRKTVEHLMRGFKELALFIDDDEPESADHVPSLVSVLKFQIEKWREAESRCAALLKVLDQTAERARLIYGALHDRLPINMTPVDKSAVAQADDALNRIFAAVAVARGAQP